MTNVPELPELPVRPELPELPLESRWEQSRRWATTICLVILAGAAAISPFIAANALSVADGLQQENRCRSQLAAEAQGAEGTLNSTGWEALLDAFAGAPDEATQRAAAEMERLSEELRVAQARRENAVELCEEDV